MSTFIEFSPESSTTKKMEYVRIDNDFEITVGVNTSNTLSYHYYDFSGIPDDYKYEPDPADDIVEFAQLVKDGDAESLTIRIKMFYNASAELEPHQIPRAWTYGRPIDKNHYLPGELLDTLSQTFPVVIWNTLSDGATQPVAHTANPATPPSVFSNRLFARLGTVANRRRYLIDKVIGILNSPDLMWLPGGGMMPAITSQGINAQRGGTVTFDFSQRVQGFWFWLEIIVRAISLDSNLQDPNGEQKFNLLDGELSLDIVRLIGKIPLSLNGDIADVAPRTGWNFRRFGSISSSSPYAYTSPSYNQSTIPSHLDTTIDIGTSVPSAVTTNWLSWLRSLV